MLSKYNLTTLWVPLNRQTRNNIQTSFHHSGTIPQCDIYASPDFFTNEERLLCLIQGTGNVRAGIWARSVCINESLELGSVLPFLDDAVKNKMSVIVFNPNERKDPITGKTIPEFVTMERHCLWVWNNIVKKYSKAKEIYIVAHSMGGYCTVDLVKVFTDDLNDGLIKRIAFTDSVHSTRCRILDKKTLANLQKVSI
jgi:hypothetical protein